MQTFRLISIAVLLLSFQLSNAQYPFTAYIKDSITNEPLVGAFAIEKGTTNGNAADINGKVKLRFSQRGNHELELGMMGYKTKNCSISIPQTDSSTTFFLIPEVTELNQVTVTSVRTHSTIENTPTKVEVLGTEEVSEENGIKPGNIMSLLGDIAGIQMQQVSASSGNAYARIQGLNGRYTQILKDGLPLFGGMSGNFSIMQIPPLDLKQIEIIKGCGSTLYGADAIGGIINLISKDPSEKKELSLTLNQTTLMESDVNIYASQKNKKLGYTFFAGGTYQKQHDVDNDKLSDVPRVNSMVVHPKLYFYLNPKSTLVLNYTATLDKRQGGSNDYFSAKFNDTLYHVQNETQRHNADIKWVNKFSESSDLTFKFSGSLLNNELGTKNYTLQARQYIYYSELSFFTGSEKADWVAGVNYNGDVFKNHSLFLSQVTNYNYSTIGLFIQNTWKISKKISLESGLREDYHSQYGFFTLPRFSLMYKLNNKLTTRVNGGLGYKIPVQLAYVEPETDLQKTITANLEPEHSQGLNADINFQHYFNKKLSITLNQAFFITSISKPVIDSSTVTTKINLINASKCLNTKGLQTYMRVNYNDMELYFGYVYTQVKQSYDKFHATPVATPKHNVAATFFYDISENFVLGLESSYIASQLDENYKPVKNYFLLAAMIRVNLGRFSFVLNGENLFDFRQSRHEQIFDGTPSNPVFHTLWAPIDGRVINLSAKWTI